MNGLVLKTRNRQFCRTNFPAVSNFCNQKKLRFVFPIRKYLSKKPKNLGTIHLFHPNVLAFLIVFLFYWYFYGSYSQELFSLTPLLATHGISTSDSSRFTVQLLKFRKSKCRRSFILWIRSFYPLSWFLSFNRKIRVQPSRNSVGKELIIAIPAVMPAKNF